VVNIAVDMATSSALRNRLYRRAMRAMILARDLACQYFTSLGRQRQQLFIATSVR
jgi:hypothetical protein